MARRLNQEQKAKRRHWRAHIKAFEESGLGPAAYCREHDLVAENFRYWRRVLGPAKKKASALTDTSEMNFVAVKFEEDELQQTPPRRPSQQRSGLTFELPTGLRLILDNGFDSGELSRVLKVLGVQAC